MDEYLALVEKLFNATDKDGTIDTQELHSEAGHGTAASGAGRNISIAIGIPVEIVS